MNTDTISTPPTALPTTYEGLVARHMLRPLHDRSDYDNAASMVDALSGLDLNEDQEEYLEALSILIEAYEQDQMAWKGTSRSGSSGLEILRWLCAENGLSGAGLAEILGVSRSLGVKILSGDRALTVSHLEKLANRFQVSPNLFLAPAPAAKSRKR
ncbi:MAG: helix-turn-helix domain-containing protein [Verrucomicrobiae bacterium]|nr:helix-turn-helix domain-containing protein [Verrucomicrobiae bacterium]